MTTVYQGSTVRLKAEWKDFSEAYVTPSSQTVTLVPFSGADIDAGTPTESETGIYYIDYVLSASAVVGQWKVKWKATIASKDEILVGYFDVEAP